MRNKVVFRQAQRAGAIAQNLFMALIEKTWAFDFDGPYPEAGEDSVNMIVPAAKYPNFNRAAGWFTKFDHAKFRHMEAQGFHSVTWALLSDRNSVWAFVTACAAVRRAFESECNFITDLITIDF
jgi:hypothetical protein